MNIGIIGRARSGKDTAGRYFVEQHGYRRVAFADPLKEAALRLDPIVEHKSDEVWDLVYDEWELVRTDIDSVHLSAVVADNGWERAKDDPEVRRILQELGMAMRAVDEEIWIRAALAKACEANDAGVPVVITDVRLRNEAESLKRAGFHLLHIDRPGVPQLDHESEGALGAADADFQISNHGSVEYLHGGLESVWEDVHAEQSRRFAMKF